MLVVFVYGMVGWTIFDDDLPRQWGDIGSAMLTLFVLLTLENFPATLERGMQIHSWSWLYFVSYAMVAAFIVLNLLIGVVLHSMEEAREIERRSGSDTSRDSPDAVAGPGEGTVYARIATLRTALDDLERELAVATDRIDGGRRPSS